MPAQVVLTKYDNVFDLVTQGNVFCACLQSASEATFGTALTATAVTLTLYNPVSSRFNLVLLEATASLRTGATAAFELVYALNDDPSQAIPNTLTSLASFPKNCLVGSGVNSVAKVYTAATLPAAPRAYRVMVGCAGTTTTGTPPTKIVDNLAGKIVLTPNTALTIQGVSGGASVEAGLLSYIWQEVPAA